MVLEAIKSEETVAEPATQHELHPTQIAAWKREAVEKLAKVFDEKGSAAPPILAQAVLLAAAQLLLRAAAVSAIDANQSDPCTAAHN